MMKEYSEKANRAEVQERRDGAHLEEDKEKKKIVEK
jgi:hypothetical protein